MDDLKKAFNAARSFKEQTIKQAAEEMGVSETFVHKYFNGDAVSAPLTQKIKEYISSAGITKSIHDLGLDPATPIKKVTPVNP